MTLSSRLRELSEKATGAPWHVGENPVIRGSIEVDGSVDTYSGPVRSSIAHFDLVEATDGDGRHLLAASIDDQMVRLAEDIEAGLHPTFAEYVQ